MSEPRIRLSLASATVLDNHLHGEPVYEDKLRAAKAELGRAVARKEWAPAARRSEKAAEPLAFPKPSALEDERRRHKKHGKKARRTMEVYDAVRLRAGGICECGCKRSFNDGPILVSAPELDHFWGRAREESVEACWMIRAHCHRTKTDNVPSRYVWIGRFYAHCLRHGYAEQAARCVRETQAEDFIARAAEVSRAGR